VASEVDDWMDVRLSGRGWSCACEAAMARRLLKEFDFAEEVLEVGRERGLILEWVSRGMTRLSAIGSLVRAKYACFTS
jgi:hypothetical protein